MRQRIPILVSLSLAVALTVVYLRVTSPRRGLDRFLKELATVEVGKTKLEGWRVEVQKAHLSGSTLNCEGQVCAFAVTFENRLLHELRLAPRSSVRAEVQFKDGIASEIYVWVEVYDAPDAGGVMYPGTGATVHQVAEAQSCNQRYSSYVNRHERRSWATIGMDSCVTPEDRAKAFGINSTCLTRIGGCKGVEAIIPQVFRRP